MSPKNKKNRRPQQIKAQYCNIYYLYNYKIMMVIIYVHYI